MADGFRYSAEVDLDFTALSTSVSRAQKDLNKLAAEGGDAVAAVNDLQSEIEDIQTARLAEIAKGFELGGQAAAESAKQLQFYKEWVEEVRREINKFSAEQTESALKLTPQQRDEQKAALEEERAIRKAIADEEKANAEREKQFIAERQAAFQRMADERKNYISEVEAAERRAHEAAVQRAQQREQAEAAGRRQELDALRRDIEERNRAIVEQEQAMASYSTNIYAAQVKEIKEMEPALRQAQQGTQAYREAMAQLNQEQEQYIQGLSNARYALFDVSRVFTIIGAASLGMATAGVATAASFERSFAEVARTVQGSEQYLNNLERQLVSLSTRMPASFGEISGVAALGGQLDIAAEYIDEFTETVIQFAATTDVSADRAAESLGRLSQLSGAPQSELSNLAAAIYDVGTNSVATEGNIISIAEEIAVAGQLAGFTAQETIGLAGALASLGIQPQAARGSIQRIFQEITKAVGEGGDELNRFAQIADMSAGQFVSTWQDAPQQAFTALVEGLSRVVDEGGNVTNALAEIGITGTRDVQVMQVLAANTEVYANTLRTANEAYAENTALAEGYETVSRTMTEQLTMLWNTLKAIVATGFGPLADALTPVITLLGNFAERLYEFSQTPVGGFLMSVTGALMGLVGIIALVGAGFTRLLASLYGMITGLRGYIRSMEETIGGKTRLSLAIRTLSADLARMHPFIARATGGFFGLARATQTASGASYTAATGVRVLTGALRGLMISTGIGAAIAGLGWAVTKLTDIFSDGSAAANSFVQDTAGLADAIKQDTQIFAESGEAFATYNREVSESGSRLAPWAQELSNAAGAQVDLNERTAEATESIRMQKVALGETTEAFIAHQMATNESFQEFFQDNAEAMRQAGVDLQEAIRAALTEEDGGANYFQGLIDDANAAALEISERMSEAMEAGDFHRADQLRSQTQEIDQQIRMLELLKNQFADTDASIKEATLAVDTFNAVNDAMGGILTENEDALTGVSEAAENYADGLFDSINATIAMDEALIGLHESINEHGDSFDYMTENGAANMQALEQAVNVMSANTEGDLAGWANGMAEIFAHVEFSSGVLGDEVDFLRVRMLEAFNQTYGIDLDISSARQSIHQFIADAIAAVEARAQLEREYFAAQRTAGDPSRPTFYAEAAGSVRGASNIEGTQSMLPMLEQQLASLRNLQTQLTNVGNTGSRVGDQIARGFDRAGGGARRAGRGARDAGRQAREAQKELRTLVDYANDLDSVWNRAFDIRFGVSIAKDNSAEALQSLKDRAEEAQTAIRDARQQIQELRASLQQLSADRSILQYQLGVAIEYGDELRAAQIRAELAENAAEAKDRENELADANKELQSAQDEATKSLTGNTKGARANREQVMALVQAYQAEIIALANSGASTDQLNARTQQLRAEFVRQLTQMGYNRNEVERYAKSFDDLRVVIGRVPRNITVRANTNPAQQALNEFVARNNNRRINMRVNTSGLPRSVSGGTYRPSRVNVGSGGISTPRIKANRTDSNIFDVWQTRTKKSHNFAGGGEVGYLASGGVHGLHPGAPKGTDTVPAWLTPGEFVQRKKAVDYYGLPFMNAINSLKFPKYLAAGTSGGGSGGNAGPRIQAVELLPHQMRQLADMISIDIEIGQRQIAGAANSSNVRDSRRGRN